jgi:hypothetical protein
VFTLVGVTSPLAAVTYSGTFSITELGNQVQFSFGKGNSITYSTAITDSSATQTLNETVYTVPLAYRPLTTVSATIFGNEDLTGYAANGTMTLNTSGVFQFVVVFHPSSVISGGASIPIQIGLPDTLTYYI